MPKDIYELFAGWKDDGIRDHELDWGRPQGDELSWINGDAKDSGAK